MRTKLLHDPRMKAVAKAVRRMHRRSSLTDGCKRKAVVKSSDAVAMYVNNSRGFHVNQGHPHRGKGVLPLGTYGLDGLSSALGASLPPTGVLHNGSAQFDLVPTSQTFLGHTFEGSHSQVSPQASLSQCPLSQAQCEQFLSFLKSYIASGSSTSAQNA
nr:hypothetical protein CFP56_25649 [Quercus suber]